jgi:hypothetical protein
MLGSQIACWQIGAELPAYAVSGFWYSAKCALVAVATVGPLPD